LDDNIRYETTCFDTLGRVASEGRGGRPRSEQARRAVLHAADDLLVEVGYAAMTLKGLAERAGVGRQTIYRWWATKAEVLLEACREDFAQELVLPSTGEPVRLLTAYLRELGRFLTESPAGLAYRALLGEAQQDAAVRELVSRDDPLLAGAGAVLDRVSAVWPAVPERRLAAAQLLGPVVVPVLAGSGPLPPRLLRAHVGTLAAAWGGPPTR
jgi:AcrR family transcriptional regulator